MIVYDLYSMTELQNNMNVALQLYKQYYSTNVEPESKNESTQKEEQYTAADEIAETIQNVAQQIIRKLKDEKIVSESQSEQITKALSEFVRTFQREQRVSAIINLFATFALPYFVEFFMKMRRGASNGVAENV